LNVLGRNCKKLGILGNDWKTKELLDGNQECITGSVDYRGSRLQM